MALTPSTFKTCSSPSSLPFTASAACGFLLSPSYVYPFTGAVWSVSTGQFHPKPPTSSPLLLTLRLQSSFLTLALHLPPLTAASLPLLRRSFRFTLHRYWLLQKKKGNSVNKVCVSSMVDGSQLDTINFAYHFARSEFFLLFFFPFVTQTVNL